MDFEKLPSNSERLLHKIVSADNLVNVLSDLFEKVSSSEVGVQLHSKKFQNAYFSRI